MSQRLPQKTSRPRIYLATIAVLTISQLSAAETANANTILIDGSTTVYPITVAVAERYVAENPQANVEVLVSGSSAGLRRLLAGEIPIANSSRAINADEQAKAKNAGIEVVELPVAYDGLTVVVNHANTFVDHLTVDELKRMWQNESTIKTWKDVRATWPDQPIAFVSAGRDNGTYDYFTEAITGKARNQRSDIPYVEAMGDRIQGVLGNQQSISYMGYVYYLDSATMLRAVPIDGGKGPVLPNADTIQSGSYQPLSRPLFIYINKAALSRPEVANFAEFYLRTAQKVVKEVGYVPLSDAVSSQVRARFAARTTGTLFPSSHDVGRMAELLGVAKISAAQTASTTQKSAEAVPVRTTPAPAAVVAAAPTKTTTVTAPQTTVPVPVVVAPAAAATSPATTVRPVVTPVPVADSAPTSTPTIAPAPIPAAEPLRAPTPIRPAYGDAFAAVVTQVGSSSLVMARSTLDPHASLDELERNEQALRSDLDRMHQALPDRRLLESAIASGVDNWRTAALALIQTRASGADSAALHESVRGVTETTQRDLLSIIEAAHTPVEQEAARLRETSANRFREACTRWLGDVTPQ